MSVSDSASRVLGYFHGCREVRMEGEWGCKTTAESLQLLNFLTTLTRLGNKREEVGYRGPEGFPKLEPALHYSGDF